MAKLLIDNQFISELKQQILNAQKKIYAIIYLVFIHSQRKSAETTYIQDLLIDAKYRGVDVRILMNRKVKGGTFTKHNLEFAKNLKCHDIVIAITDTNRTTHSKVWAIDDQTVIVGSHNLTDSSLHRNREISILLEDEKINNELSEYIKNEIINTKTQW